MGGIVFIGKKNNFTKNKITIKGSIQIIKIINYIQL